MSVQKLVNRATILSLFDSVLVFSAIAVASARIVFEMMSLTDAFKIAVFLGVLAYIRITVDIHFLRKKLEE